MVTRAARGRAWGLALLELARAERRAASVGGIHPSMWRRGFLSTRWFMYPGIDEPGALFVNDLRAYTRIRHLNRPAGRVLVQHKHVFADALTARGLSEAAPELYGLVTARGFRARSPGVLERLSGTVVVKPVTGHGGRGVRVVPVSEVAALTAERGGELLVQERLKGHPVLHRIHPGSLNTARILMVRVEGGGTVPVAAVHRFGTAETTPVDNGSSGGLWAPVDMGTGRLGPALTHPSGPRRPEHPRHPETGARISGVLVPQWDSVLDLARRLMGAFGELDHVGWDIAVTEHGPRVIEGNAIMPALSIFQYSGTFLDDPRVRDYYLRNGMLSEKAVRLAAR